jgi:hypothetical protein
MRGYGLRKAAPRQDIRFLMPIPILLLPAEVFRTLFPFLQGHAEAFRMLFPFWRVPTEALRISFLFWQ